MDPFRSTWLTCIAEKIRSSSLLHLQDELSHCTADTQGVLVLSKGDAGTPMPDPGASEKQVLMTLTKWLPQTATAMNMSEPIPLLYSSTVNMKMGETLQPLNPQSTSCLTPAFPL